MALLGEHVKAEAFLNSSCSASSLFGIRFEYERLDEPGKLPSLIKSRIRINLCRYPGMWYLQTSSPYAAQYL